VTGTVGQTLVELRVRNLGVIDDVTIVLPSGMTALTGETGAGKTLVVGALNLLLGARADHSLIRAGAEEAVVEARFGGPGGEGELVLARSLAPGGRSRAWIDGRMATVSAVGAEAATRIDVHGQQGNRSLTEPSAQRKILDLFGHIDLDGLVEARRLKHLLDEAAALGGDVQQRTRHADLLRFQIDEIENAAIEDEAEDHRLDREESRLAAASAHRQAAAAALTAVSGSDGDGPTPGPEASGALDRLAQAAQALAGYPALVDLAERVGAAMADLSDLSGELRSVIETWEDDPRRLDEVRARRHHLRQLMHKYGDTLEETLAFADGARAQLAAVESDQRRAAELDAVIEAARGALELAEADVASARRRAAPELAEVVERTLRTLAMPSARFEVSVDGPGAADEITFHLGANRGEPLLPLAKAASGGELARTMLAIRLAVTDAPGLMVFDEVDAGVGGAAATAVGAALARLGCQGQVVVVTHLAQVAAQADHQLEVHKTEREGRTVSEVAALDTEGRVTELSRMLSGRPDSSSARRHAEELLGGSPG